MHKVLVVEDDAAINDIVSTRLRRDELDVVSAFSGTEAVILLESTAFDAIVCDVMLPGLPGDQVISRIRQSGNNTPVLVISAKAMPADKINLLELGADDYLGKPFDLDELSARVRVQLRRKQYGAQPQGAIIRHGRWEIDLQSRSMRIDGVEISLTRTEFNIVELLTTNPKRVFTKQELFERAWGEPYMAQESTVAAHVSNLRSKLKTTGTDSYIQTVWGIGFKLATDLQ